MQTNNPIRVPRDVMKSWKADKSPAGVAFLASVLEFNDFLKKQHSTDAHAAIQQLYGRLTNES